MVLESTKLVSDPLKTEQIVEYDTRVHRRLSLNSLFCFNSIHVVTKGMFTRPAKSMFIFAHNSQLTAAQLRSHPIIAHVSHVRSKSELMELEPHSLMPPLKPIDFSQISSKRQIDLVEFNQEFYIRAFKDPYMRPQDLEPLCLRVCAFIDLKDENMMNKIPFSQPFACRFVSVLFTDRLDHNHLFPAEDGKPDVPNVDVQTIYFSGHEIPSLLNAELPEGNLPQ